MRAIRTSLLLTALVAFAGPAQAARNILLVIADDYGIDVTRYYPLTDRRTTADAQPREPDVTTRWRMIRDPGVTGTPMAAGSETLPQPIAIGQMRPT